MKIHAYANIYTTYHIQLCRENNAAYSAWQEIPVGKNPRWNQRRVIPVAIVTVVVPSVVTQPWLT